MKTSQHLLSSVCIALKVSPYAQATTLQSSFEGPGRLECFRGECDFNVDHGFGCSDPCHTHTRSNMYEYTFEDVSVMSDDLFLPTETTRNTDMSDLPCYYMHASLINTTDWFDPWPLKIDEGCHAVCTGCTFYQTLTFSGPGSLACTDGSCYNYTYGNKYNDCGVDLEDVSGDWVIKPQRMEVVKSIRSSIDLNPSKNGKPLFDASLSGVHNISHQYFLRIVKSVRKFTHTIFSPSQTLSEWKDEFLHSSLLEVRELLKLGSNIGSSISDSLEVVGSSDGTSTAVINEGNSRSLNLSDDTLLGDTNVRSVDDKTVSIIRNGAVQELILPFGKRLGEAEDRMKELPYALYDSQDILVRDIVNTGKGSIKKGLALLGGIQINTSPDTLDYFHPLRFDYYDENGNFVEDLLPSL
ncbi:hypothetical protein THAPSDRAFT_bd1766 [Thalassiosira pseudonana CCMP1335]|uniref:Limiting CO2-inducible protein B/C beta carbonyic anhydrase domain-containing protein n=1 Tax=Thalassiosira pseudonana TaxID=35128 RepID=B8LE18_THAPS|nr:hypothetical protein THAPSDRAFT_bd1766 [Thalassiosira pseudonana CCMP1335]EED86434.1 hypothetical protein THAPSDRAFT_bd1766 [Thalassiosira pseudonana CCMP1335]